MYHLFRFFPKFGAWDKFLDGLVTLYLPGSFPNSEFGWPKDVKDFTKPTIPNTARMTLYYAPKHILMLLNNPKTPQIRHPRRTYRGQDLKIAKAPNLVKNKVLELFCQKLV